MPRAPCTADVQKTDSLLRVLVPARNLMPSGAGCMKVLRFGATCSGRCNMEVTLRSTLQSRWRSLDLECNEELLPGRYSSKRHPDEPDGNTASVHAFKKIKTSNTGSNEPTRFEHSQNGKRFTPDEHPAAACERMLVLASVLLVVVSLLSLLLLLSLFRSLLLLAVLDWGWGEQGIESCFWQGPRSLACGGRKGGRSNGFGRAGAVQGSVGAVVFDARAVHAQRHSLGGCGCRRRLLLLMLPLVASFAGTG